MVMASCACDVYDRCGVTDERFARAMSLEDAEYQQEHEGHSISDGEDGYGGQNGDETYDDDDDDNSYLR